MTETQLSLNAGERDCLVELLKEALKGFRVEEHRTRAPSFREHILAREKLITAILQKLGVAQD